MLSQQVESNRNSLSHIINDEHQAKSLFTAPGYGGHGPSPPRPGNLALLAGPRCLRRSAATKQAKALMYCLKWGKCGNGLRVKWDVD